MEQGELVSVAAGARALGINKSTLSRYLNKHPELVADRTARNWPLIDVEAVRQHRADNLQESKALNHAGGGVREDADDAPAESETGERRSRTANSTLNQARAVEAAAKAQKTQIELAQMKGELCTVKSVEDGGFEAGRRLQEGLMRATKPLADKIATMNDPREIKALLDAELRGLLEGLAADLLNLGKVHEENERQRAA